jgi:hypothetical protein
VNFCRRHPSFSLPVKEQPSRQRVRGLEENSRESLPLSLPVLPSIYDRPPSYAMYKHVPPGGGGAGKGLVPGVVEQTITAGRSMQRSDSDSTIASRFVTLPPPSDCISVSLP